MNSASKLPQGGGGVDVTSELSDDGTQVIDAVYPES
jgi:hypothetical protein